MCLPSVDQVREVLPSSLKSAAITITPEDLLGSLYLLDTVWAHGTPLASCRVGIQLKGDTSQDLMSGSFLIDASTKQISVSSFTCIDTQSDVLPNICEGLEQLTKYTLYAPRMPQWSKLGPVKEPSCLAYLQSTFGGVISTTYQWSHISTHNVVLSLDSPVLRGGNDSKSEVLSMCASLDEKMEPRYGFCNIKIASEQFMPFIVSCKDHVMDCAWRERDEWQGMQLSAGPWQILHHDTFNTCFNAKAFQHVLGSDMSKLTTFRVSMDRMDCCFYDTTYWKRSCGLSIWQDDTQKANAGITLSSLSGSWTLSFDAVSADVDFRGRGFSPVLVIQSIQWLRSFAESNWSITLTAGGVGGVFSGVRVWPYLGFRPDVHDFYWRDEVLCPAMDALIEFWKPSVPSMKENFLEQLSQTRNPVQLFETIQEFQRTNEVFAAWCADNQIADASKQLTEYVNNSYEAFFEGTDQHCITRLKKTCEGKPWAEMACKL